MRPEIHSFRLLEDDRIVMSGKYACEPLPRTYQCFEIAHHGDFCVLNPNRDKDGGITRVLSPTERTMIADSGIVVEATLFYPRFDRYGLPSFGFHDAMSKSAICDLGYVVSQDFSASLQCTGDDSAEVYILSIALAPSLVDQIDEYSEFLAAVAGRGSDRPVTFNDPAFLNALESSMHDCTAADSVNAESNNSLPMVRALSPYLTQSAAEIRAIEAERFFESFDFGDLVIVDSEAWISDGPFYSRTVYADNQDSPSSRLSFGLQFDNSIVPRIVDSWVGPY